MKSARQYELDLVKAIAIPFLIFGHIVEVVFSRIWEDAAFCNFSVPWEIVLIGMNIIIASSFMFSMGASIPFSRNQSARLRIKRGFSLIVMWFALHLWIMLPLGIKFAQPMEVSFWQFYTVYLFTSNILFLAGAFFIYYGLLTSCKSINLFGVVAISACLFGLGHFVSYSGDSFFLLTALGNFIFTEESSFPFLNWIMLPVFGLCWGKLLQRSKNQNKLYLIFGGLGIVSLACIFGILWQRGMLDKAHLDEWMDVHFFYNVDIIKLIVICSFLAVFFSISYLITRVIRWEGFHRCYAMLAKNLTTLYVIQWMVIPWSAFCVPTITESVSPWWAVLMAVVVFGLTLAIFTLWNTIKMKLCSTQK